MKHLMPALFSSSCAARFEGVRPMSVPPSLSNSIARCTTSNSVDLPEPGGPSITVRP